MAVIGMVDSGVQGEVTADREVGMVVREHGTVARKVGMGVQEVGTVAEATQDAKASTTAEVECLWITKYILTVGDCVGSVGKRTDQIFVRPEGRLVVIAGRQTTGEPAVGG